MANHQVSICPPNRLFENVAVPPTALKGTPYSQYLRQVAVKNRIHGFDNPEESESIDHLCENGLYPHQMTVDG